MSTASEDVARALDFIKRWIESEPGPHYKRFVHPKVFWEEAIEILKAAGKL